MNKKKIIGFLAAAASTAAVAGFNAMNAFADEAQAATSAADGQPVAPAGGLFSMLLPLIIMFGLLYFIAIRPQKKRDKELKDMQSSLQVGDEVVTGGGIVGIVVSVGEDTVVIETGGAKHKLRIKNWAITENVTAMERMKEAKASAGAKKAAVESAAVVDDTVEEKKSKKKDKDEE